MRESANIPSLDPLPKNVDLTTKDHKSTVSDDGTTFDRTEVVTGA